MNVRAMAVTSVLALVACGGSSTPPTAPPPTLHPVSADVMLIADPSVFPQLAARLPADLDLTGRVLLLPGGWLPDRIARVVVLDPVASPSPAALAGVVGPGVAPAERVIATIQDGALSIAFEHDVNADGWCCSGVYAPDDRAECSTLPPFSPIAESDDLVVFLFVVPAEAARAMHVERTASICVRP